MFLDLSNKIGLWPWPSSRYHRGRGAEWRGGGGARGSAERKKGRERGRGGGLTNEETEKRVGGACEDGFTAGE